MGAIFSIGALSVGNILLFMTLAVGSILLVAHVFVFNDWSGIHGDLRDPNRTLRTFAAAGASRRQIGLLAAVLLALSLLLFGFLGTAPLLLALAIAGLSALYSAPTIHTKGVPLLSSLLHFAGGAFHFLLSYTTFVAFDARGVAISCFFALVFTAGHFMQETRDFEGDLHNGIRTNAVAFGKEQTFFAGSVLFTAAYVLLVVLTAFGIVPRILVLAAALYPLHLWASLQALRAGLDFESLRRFRRCYRLLYAVIGIMMVSTVLLG